MQTKGCPFANPCVLIITLIISVISEHLKQKWTVSAGYLILLFSVRPFSNSANQENCEVVPPHNDAQPEGSTVETTDDARLV